MARDFDGSTNRIDYVTGAGSGPFDPTGVPITISMWVMFDILAPVTSPDYFFCANTPSTFGVVFDQRATNNGQLAFTRNGTSILSRVTDASVVTTGVWTHCLVHHDGNIASAAAAHIYVNGTEPGYVTTTNGSGEFPASSTWSLGGRLADDLRNFNGKIAEAAAWDLEPSSAMIQALANGYSPAFFPRGLRWYADLITHQRDRMPSGGVLDGTTEFPHPAKMRYPRRRQSRGIAAVVGGGGGDLTLPIKILNNRPMANVVLQG